MKRIKIIVPVALLLLITLILLFNKTDPLAPAFIPWQGRSLPSYRSIHYEWGAADPFAGGKMWLWITSGPTNFHTVLYDLDNHIPIGELTNAGSILANHDYSKLLCYGHDSLATSWKEKFVTKINKISFGKIQLKTSTYTETVWVLDRQRNSAVRIGELTQRNGSGDMFRPSPGSRYAYTVPSASREDHEFFLCDLEKEKLTKIRLDGKLSGWWDDHSILVKDPDNNFILFDVASRTKTMLWSIENLTQQFKQLGILSNPIHLNRSFSVWNGSTNDFYFDIPRNISKRSSADTLLLKADRTTLTLRLVYPEFKFEHLGRLNPSGTHYLYNGRLQNGSGDGSVHLRDLRNNIDQLLVAPTGTPGFALPRFYRDTVIYFRTNALWRIDLTGSNNAPLFPQPAAPSK